MERAKVPGIDDRKSVHISNIDRLTIVDPRELSRCSKSKFLTARGIILKKVFFFLCITFFSLSFSQEKETPSCGCDPLQTSKAFTWVAKKAIPAVVFIKAEGNVSDQDLFGLDDSGQYPFDYFGEDFLHRFFGFQPQEKAPKQPKSQVSQGSGFIVNGDGYLMTNAHVVKGADKITAVLNDGREMEAALIGADSQTDIAILKIDCKDLPSLVLGDSDAMEIGEWVIAIGSPFQLEASLTVGVISAKGRQNLQITKLEDFIQTDAAINPGNSGGPLLNLNSEVIGINTAIVSKSGGYMGIGFAIPSNMAKNVMNQIIEKGGVTRGFLGVTLQAVDKEIAAAFNLEKPEGALVTEVIKDSPAEKGGIKQGDIIVEYDGHPVKNPGNLIKAVSFMEPDSTIVLKINRKGKLLTLKIKLGKSSTNIVASGGVVQQLGMEVENLSPEMAKQLGYSPDSEGVVVTRIKPGSMASQAGIRPGFLILDINHKKIKTVDDFNEAINTEQPNKRVLIRARQGNVTRFYSLRLE